MALDNQDWTKAAGSGGASYTGVLAALTNSAPLAVGGASAFAIFATIAGGGTLAIRASIDGVTYIGLRFLGIGPGDWNEAFQPTAPTGTYLVPCLGYSFIQVQNVQNAGTVTYTANPVLGVPFNPSLGQKIALASLPVVLASDTPLPAAPRPTGLLSAKWGQTNIANATLAIVAGVANQVITVYEINWSAETAAAGVQEIWLEDTTPANQLSSVRVNTVAPITMSADFPWGFPLAIGKGLQAHVGGGAPNVDHGGVVFYTQA